MQAGDVAAVRAGRRPSTFTKSGSPRYSARSRNARRMASMKKMVLGRGTCSRALRPRTARARPHHLQQRDSAGAGRRHGDDLIAAIAAAQRCAFDRRIALEVGERDVAAIFRHGVGNQAGSFRPRRIRVGRLFGFASASRPARAGARVRRPDGRLHRRGKIRFDSGKRSRCSALRRKRSVVVLRDDEAIGREPARGLANIRPRDFARSIFLLRQREARDRSRNAARPPADGR